MYYTRKLPGTFSQTHWNWHHFRWISRLVEVFDCQATRKDSFTYSATEEILTDPKNGWYDKDVENWIYSDSINVLMKAIAERGRYESLPIFFGHAIDLQLSIDHAHWRVKSRNWRTIAKRGNGRTPDTDSGSYRTWHHYRTPRFNGI